MRRLAGTRKVGHLGTLDPGATGVLPLVIGRATRLAQFYIAQRQDLRRRDPLRLLDATYDADGEATSPEVAVTLEREDARARVRQFRGRVVAGAAAGLGEENRGAAGV